jgi:hypothetical protein
MIDRWCWGEYHEHGTIAIVSRADTRKCATCYLIELKCRSAKRWASQK